MEAQKHALALKAKKEEIQKKYEELLKSRQNLTRQQLENTQTKEELDLLKEDAKIFKMVGPILVNQELSSAKKTVTKRLEFIDRELKRVTRDAEETEKLLQKAHADFMTAAQKLPPREASAK